MNSSSDYISASPCSNPFHNIADFESKMKSETEETFEFGIKIKGRNAFWILYLTDKLSKAWGFTLMIGNWTLINYFHEDNQMEKQS